MKKSISKTAIVLGSTGLVGSQLVKQLFADDRYAKVVCPSRRELPFSHAKLEVVIVDFDRLSDFSAAFKGDDIFICLGTTRATAGSDEAFRKVDLDYVVESASLGAAQGGHHCLLVSSVGADASSSLLYSKTKGEAEDAVQKLAYKAVSIFRPSILLGDRKEKRVMESIGKSIAEGLDALFSEWLGRYRPIEAATVAEGMIIVANLDRSGVHIYASNKIIELVD